MNRDSNPDTVSRLEQRHVQLVKNTYRLHAPQLQHQAQQSMRASLDEDDRWFGAALVEDLATIAFVLVVVLLCALAGVYGLGVRDLAWGMLP